MSLKNLRKAARQPVGGLGERITFVCMADRADRRGRFSVTNNDALMDELAAETNAVMARFRGDHSVRWGVNNDRVDRVYDALREALEEEGG